MWEELTRLEQVEDDKEDKKKKKKKKQTNKKKKLQNLEPDYFYLLKTSHIFPLDIDISSKCKSPLFSQRLRPEFVSDYLSYPLSNGAFINPYNTNES